MSKVGCIGTTQKMHVTVRYKQFKDLKALKVAIIEAYKDSKATVLVHSVKSENTLGLRESCWANWPAVRYVTSEDDTQWFDIPPNPETVYFFELE